MNTQIGRLIGLLIAILMVIGGTSAQAQDTGAVTRNIYYVAGDASGVQQVYQLLLGSDEEARQITFAENDVVTFGAAYDGLSIAYISDGQLWLQPIHTEEAESLATISAVQFLSSPVYSQDGQYIAYTDNGVSLLDLATRETRQLLANVPLEADASNAGEFRIFQPERFVLDENGAATRLIVDVGVWEWNTVGVVELESGELQELEAQVHTSLLPLADGRVLLYGNGGVGGEPALHIADSLDDINTYTELVDFASLTDDIVFAEQAVEIVPGVVRILGQTIGTTPDQVAAFYFDYHLMNNTAEDVNVVTLSDGSAGITIAGPLSPDGGLLPVYLNALYTDEHMIYGDMQIFDLMTGEAIAIFAQTFGVFRWQP